MLIDVEEAIRILNPRTMLQTLEEIEYYHGLKGPEVANEKLRAALFFACDIMREHLNEQVKGEE